MSECNISIWNATVNQMGCARLEKSLETDILIIGAGITGITCAYCLAEKGFKPVLIEAGGLCDGTTGNTTGKITIQHNIIYSNLIRKYGKEPAKQYAESQDSALTFIREQVNRYSIDCQLMDIPSYVYADTKDALDAVEKEYEAAVLLGIEAELLRKPAFPKGSLGMVGFKHQAAFHPIRYLQVLAHSAVSMGAALFFDTKAVRLEDGEPKTVFCEHDITVKAKHVVMATQFPFFDGPNLFFARLYAKRAYGMAVRPKRDWPDGNFINVGSPTRSIRSHMENGTRILIVVGENHDTGRGEPDTELHFKNLTDFAEEIAGVGEILARWSAQDYDTPDQIPYIGRVSNHSDLYVAAGFGKWGMTSGTLAGSMIADLIATGTCRYEKLYSRTRADFFHAPGKAISGIFSPVGELIRSKLEGTQSIQDLKQGEGRVIRFGGQKAGIYRDFYDSVIVLDISCTHMSTELNFNPAEKTWDCPAHGGRYNIFGQLLEGPPKHSLKVLYEGNYSDLTEQ